MFLNDLYVWMQANSNLPDDIFPEKIDTSVTDTAITYSLESTNIDYSSNEPGIYESKVILAIWGKDQAEVWSIAETLINELHGLKNTVLVGGGARVDYARVLNQSTDFEADTKLYLYAMQVNFSYV